MNFSDRVYELLMTIPKGKVTTYKILAHKLNTEAYRAVGQALRRNPNAPEVPCHRVVRSDGYVGGYHGQLSNDSQKIKSGMLSREGVEIIDFKVQNLTKYLYIFITES